MQAWLIISLQFCTFWYSLIQFVTLWYSLIHGWHILLHICYTLLAESFSVVVYRAIIWLTTAVAPPVRPSGRLESPIWRATRNLVPDNSEILCFLQLWGGWVSVQSVNLNWLDWKPTGRERKGMSIYIWTLVQRRLFTFITTQLILNLKKKTFP